MVIIQHYVNHVYVIDENILSTKNQSQEFPLITITINNFFVCKKPKLNDEATTTTTTTTTTTREPEIERVEVTVVIIRRKGQRKKGKKTTKINNDHYIDNTETNEHPTIPTKLQPQPTIPTTESPSVTPEQAKTFWESFWERIG
ncbi:hypothetical protein DERP_009803 [Dermatophagoides pteronyssinus]|uniref:Uncharacterized protein n=1 Tax=Dermatophagoides pteronyssinus TaxID=6956 RepID=A0ABQ8IR66_DERPT|nr:hypothetical protein DERP_009803 [Dermatophagoides pteronyssinus]